MPLDGNRQNIRSIGIILDGNRRYAKARGLTSFEGHRKGLENLKTLSRKLPYLKDKYGLEHVTLYVFSTENWNRSLEEVAYLMGLFEAGFSEIENVVNDPHVPLSHRPRIRAIGDRERLPSRVKEIVSRVENISRVNRGVKITFALSYGGRSEIVAAANRAIKLGTQVTEKSFAMHLWSGDTPDPDIIIRTGGEKRLSNFLTWASVYSELFFTETMWPDFTIEELERIFQEFYERERRHGA